jgi:hypothetical protein
MDGRQAGNLEKQSEDFLNPAYRIGSRVFFVSLQAMAKSGNER